MVEAIRPKPIDGVFRLPLDRAFTAKGYGTVVAGIPVAGSAHLGDELVLLPQGQPGRIRSIEVYGRPAEVVKAGQCAALNMRHWDHQAIGRGDVVAVPGYFRPERWFACTLRLLSHGGEKPALKNGAKVRFHTGTSDRPAVLYTLQGDRVEAGGECLVQIGLSTPLVAGPGDRYILRTLSPVQTVGGGMVIEPLERRLKRNRPNVCEELRGVRPGGARAESLRRVLPAQGARPGGRPRRAGRFARRFPGPGWTKSWRPWPTSRRPLSPAPGLFMHAETAAEAGRRIVQILEEFHARSPESPGMTLEELREAAGLDRAVLGGLIALERAAGRIVEQGDRLAAAGHRPTFQDEDARLAEAIEGLFRQAPFHPPSAEEVAAKTGADARTVGKLLRILQEHQRLVPVGENLLCHREAVDRAGDPRGVPPQGRQAGERQVQVPAGHDPQVRPAAVGLLRPRRRDPPRGQHEIPEDTAQGGIVWAETVGWAERSESHACASARRRSHLSAWDSLRSAHPTVLRSRATIGTGPFSRTRKEALDVQAMVVGWLRAGRASAGVRPAGPAGGRARMKEAVFPMKEVSVFEEAQKARLDKDPQLHEALLGGARAFCGNTPQKEVKKYPKLNSKRPLYGSVTFGADRDDPKAAVELHFVVDESEPAAKKKPEPAAKKPRKRSLLKALVESFTGPAEEPGPAVKRNFDRLIFDVNGDLDLTNDPVLKPMKDPPKALAPEGDVDESVRIFDYLEVPLDQGPGRGKRPLRLVPQFICYGPEDGALTLLPAVARKGKIRIGKQEYTAYLVQSDAIAGRFDLPRHATAPGARRRARPKSLRLVGRLALHDAPGRRPVVPRHGHARRRQAHRQAYRGDLGVLEVGPGNRKIDAKQFGAAGVLMAKQQFAVSAGEVRFPMPPEKLARHELPVGDYQPIYLTVDFGRCVAGPLDEPLPDRRRQAPGRQAPGLHHQDPQGQAVRAGFLRQAHGDCSPPGKGRTFRPGDQVRVRRGPDRAQAGPA